MNIVISVIVPIYKAPLEYLQKCFESLVAQTLQESEFVIVSDGAPDTEISICEEYTKKDPRFKLFKCEHAGVSAARNFGIQQAKGEYITFVDCDDWIEADMCETMYSFISETDCDILVSAFSEHHLNGKQRFFRPFNEDKKTIDQKYIDLFKKNTIHIFKQKFIPAINTQCKTYKKSYLLENGIQYCTDLPIGEDRVFNFLAYSHTKKIAYINKSFYHYRLWNASSRNSYNENTLQNSFLYINKLKHLSQGKFDNELGLEAISEIWFFCSKGPFEQKYIDEMKQIIRSSNFQRLVHGIKRTTPHPLVKFDVLAYKHKCTIPIYVHLFFTWIKKKFDN